MTTSFLYKKTEDTMAVLKWKALLAKKMDALEVDYFFHNQRDYEWDENAAMNVKDLDFQKRPVVIMGYIPNLEDNYLSPLILAHEIGHCIDLKQHKHSLAYLRKSRGIIDMEIVAWEHAFRMLRAIGWTDFEQAHEFAMSCLRTYFDSPRHDKRYKFEGTHPTWLECMDRMEAARKDAEKAIQGLKLGVW